MIDHKDFLEHPNTSIVEQPAKNESVKLNLWGEILHKKALSLLDIYLPDALPKEPTELLFSYFPGYLGKFKSKHYIAAERYSISTRDMERMRHMMRDKDYIQSPKKPEDWEEPERLLNDPSQYSTDSWRGVYILVHELIHQKQAELNPTSNSNIPLFSPELDNIDPNSIDQDKLHRLLTKAHKEYGKAMDPKSLFFPVIEGMAVLGSYYVMGKLADDLMKAGKKDDTDKIHKLRKAGLRLIIKKTRDGGYKWNANRFL